MCANRNKVLSYSQMMVSKFDGGRNFLQSSGKNFRKTALKNVQDKLLIIADKI
jgi:hypothetical protein